MLMRQFFLHLSKIIIGIHWNMTITCNITQQQTNFRQWTRPEGRCRDDATVVPNDCEYELQVTTLELLTLWDVTCNDEWAGCRYGNEDDCNRVFTTSSGHVNTAPVVPPILQDKKVLCFTHNSFYKRFCRAVHKQVASKQFWPKRLKLVTVSKTSWSLWIVFRLQGINGFSW